MTPHPKAPFLSPLPALFFSKVLMTIYHTIYFWVLFIVYLSQKNISSVDTEIFVRFDHCIDHYLVLRVMTGK